MITERAEAGKRSRPATSESVSVRVQRLVSRVTADAARLGRFVLRRFEFDPFVCPLGNRVDRGDERAALLRQRVFHSDGRFWNDGARDNAFRLEFLQAIAEHPIRNVWNSFPQGCEPAP